MLSNLHVVKVKNKMLGVADEKRLCPAHIFSSKFVTAGHNCTVRQSQYWDSYLKSVAGFFLLSGVAPAFSDHPRGRKYLAACRQQTKVFHPLAEPGSGQS